MTDDLDAIVTSQIESLVKFKQQEAGLQGLIERAGARRDKVPEAVFARVVHDYEARIRALEVEAQPLRAQARAEFAKLVAVHRSAAQALEKAKIDKQEIEFRHEVGEFDDAEFEAQIGAARTSAEGCQVAFDKAEGLRRRFLEVIPDEPVAELPSVASALEPAQPRAIVPAAAAAPVAGPPASTAPSPPSPPGRPRVVAPAGEGTLVGTPAVAAAGPPGDSTGPLAALGPDAESFATVAISPSELVEDGGTAHRLGALTSIGRIASNTISIPVREVSRNHAQIILTQTGYVLKDLDSGNGTFVNGQRVREWRLKENDRIQIGDRMFLFKSR